MIQKIKKQVAIIVIVDILAIMFLGFLFYNTYNKGLMLIKEQYNTHQMMVAKQTAIGIEGTVKLLIRELEYISHAPAIQDFNLPDARKKMQETFVFLKDMHVIDLGLLDKKGIMRIALKAHQIEGGNFSNRSYFQKASKSIRSSAAFEFLAYENKNRGKNIVIAMPVFSRDERFAGAIVFNVKVDDLIKGFVPLDSGERKTCVIDGSGNILCNPRALQYTTVDTDVNADMSFNAFLEDVKTGRIFKGEYISPEKVKTIAVSFPVKIGDQTWSMVIATPEEVLVKMIGSFTVEFAIVTICVLLAVIGASLFIFRLIHRWNLELDSMVTLRTQELSFSEEKQRSIAETINELIWEIDSNGEYMYVSPVVKKILGYKPEEMIGRTIFDLMDQDDSQKFRETLKEIGRSKKPFNNLERITVHKAGNKIILETNGTPILDAAGNLEGFRGSDRDITERKRAEKALQQYAVDLEEARNNLEIKVNERTKELQIAHESLMRREKLAVLGELSSSVSHELRNPLGVIRNAIYFLNMKLSEAEDDSIRDNLKIISKEINTANKIITDLLDFTRDKSPVTLEVDVNQLAREMLSKTVMPDNINIVTDFNEELKPISVDPTQVAQVFINLIENGIGAMENGGTLTVSTRTNNNHAVEAVFTDTGCGIPEENMDRIFEPLFTTKAKGIGLGLVVSKKMAEANGGTLHVESEEGSGSIFTVSFFKRSKL